MEINLSQTYCFSELGQKEKQEDCIWPNESTSDYACLILCDGMGGHERGEVASSIVVSTLRAEFKPFSRSLSIDTAKKFLNEALTKAYGELNKVGGDSESVRKMGTTMTCLIPCSDGILSAHIGDSRIYQLRKDKGIVFRTRDHSVVAELVAIGDMTEEEARLSPIKNQITKAMMPGQENNFEPTLSTITDIRKGDVFFLCCDGVLENITNPELTRILTSKDDLSRRITTLKTICAERKTRDNYSSIAVEVLSGANNNMSFFGKLKEIFQ